LPGLQRGGHQVVVMRHLDGDHHEIDLVAADQFFGGTERQRHVVGLAG
jgi:hypothetical protein